MNETRSKGRQRAMLLLKRHWVALVLALASILYCGVVTVLHEETLSPIDEWVFVDYTYKILDSGVVREGEFVGDEVVAIAACHGIYPQGGIGVPCGETEYSNSSLPWQGLTTAAGHTPTYFFVSRVVGDAISGITGLDQLTSWRLTGALWLAGALAVMAGIFRQWRISAPVSLALGAALIASPYVWWTHTFLSTDAPALLIGALAVWVTTRFVRKEGSGWWLVPIGLIAVAFKVTNLVVLGFALLFLLASLFLSESRRVRYSSRFGPASRWMLLIIPAVAVASALVLQVFWTRTVAAIALATNSVDQGISQPLTLIQILKMSTSFLQSAITHNPGSEIVPHAVYLPLAWLVIVGVVGSVFSFSPRSDRGVYAIALGSSAILAGPILAVGLYFTSGAYFELPPRYGATLIPAFLLAAGFMMKNRLSVIIVGLYSCALVVVGIALAMQFADFY